jgi:hypothetical protein
MSASFYHPCARRFSTCTDAPEGGIEVLAYDYIEAFAENFRALAERTLDRAVLFLSIINR